MSALARLLLPLGVAIYAPMAAAYDARPFCDARALVQAKRKVLDVRRRIGVDFSVELSKDLPPPVKNPADLRELAPIFYERFLILERALFGRNGVLRFAGSANNREAKASLEPGYGVVIDVTFADLLQRERPGDTALIDLVLSHELGHYVQNSYLEVDKAHVLVKDASDISRILVAPAVQEKLKKILARKDEASLDINTSAASHGEVTWIGLMIMKAAGVPIRGDALHQLKAIRDRLVHEMPPMDVPSEQILEFNTVEFTLVDCALDAMKAR